ncbi:DDE-type integrase/transposase/recombinase [Candidatus Woesearchaeota archaeon]|nr:DDE-type integrase/transposase/recombinase [Candidatus Woesearchaeota archaeon]
MKKEEIRKEFIKLKNKGHSYAQCQIILKAKYNYSANTRTLKRWIKRLDQDLWDLKDRSTRPNTIYYKVTPSKIKQIVELRRKTGWGSDKITHNLPYLGLSPRTVDNILNKHNLTRQSKNKGVRKKWVRWQRHHPNSLWQIDHTDEMNKFNCYTLSVLDDASRYSLALVKLNNVTTTNVTLILDRLIQKFGKPRQILTDNGSAYGGKNKHSRFDRWCKRRGIQHIRTKVHSPSTNGKVERLFKTMDDELEFCNNDFERFRMRYNHFRPHSSLNNRTPGDFYNDFSKKF